MGHKEPPRKSPRGDVAGEQAVFAMAGGGRILGVSQNLSYLPKAMASSADIVLKISRPQVDLLREAIKLATGRSPRSLPNDVARGLDYSEICGAIRTGSSAKACVERLMIASQAKSKADPGLQDVPYMEDLHGYGQELEDWGAALIADLKTWRAGSLDFSAIERTVVLASPLHGELAGIDLSLVAKVGEGASGADVTGWVKSARRMARQQNRPMIFQDLFDQVAPPETRPLNLVRRVAIHEASHAMVSHLLNPGSVTGITLIGADPSEGGRTMMTFGIGDAMGREDVEKRVAIWLSGRGGEQIMLGSVSGGAGGSGDSDLARATQLLAIMHASLGLGEHLLHRATPQGVVQLLTLDPGLAKTVEAELQAIYAKTLALLQDNVDVVEAVADALVASRHLTAEQFMAVVEKTTSKIAVKPTGGRHG